MHRRTPSEGQDAAFRELMLHDAQKSLHHELERLIKTAPSQQMTVCYLLEILTIC